MTNQARGNSVLVRKGRGTANIKRKAQKRKNKRKAKR